MRKRPRILKNYIRKGGLRGEGLRGDSEGGLEIYRKGMTNGGSK